MALVRICAICKLSKQAVDPVTLEPFSDVQRYGIYRQVVIPGRFRADGKKAYHRERGYGGIDLCTSCWEFNCKVNKRNTRSGNGIDPVTGKVRPPIHRKF